VIVHVGTAEQLDDLAADVPEVARVLARACWPGALTLVVRRRPGAVAAEATGGRDTVGVRVPDHPLAGALLEAFGGPVAAPSANRFGKVSPTTAQHVRDDLGGDVDVILDGGPCDVGVESTIVDVTGHAPVVLRVGGISEARLAELVSQPFARSTEGEIAAPGTLPSHYAPNARVVLVHAYELAARVERLRASGTRVAVIDAPGDVTEYARVLYARLRDADAPHVDVIVAILPEDDGSIGAAVRDRLERAARG
jgi:L-threonylcarbamoyladenylate synthase